MSKHNNCIGTILCSRKASHGLLPALCLLSTASNREITRESIALFAIPLAVLSLHLGYDAHSFDLYFTSVGEILEAR